MFVENTNKTRHCVVFSMSHPYEDKTSFLWAGYITVDGALCENTRNKNAVMMERYAINFIQQMNVKWHIFTDLKDKVSNDFSDLIVIPLLVD